jgi:hypothetical protein
MEKNTLPKLTRDNIGIYKNKNSETQVKINLLERVFNFVFGISLILKVFSKISEKEGKAIRNFSDEINFNKKIYQESLKNKKFKNDEEKFQFLSHIVDAFFDTMKKWDKTYEVVNNKDAKSDHQLLKKLDDKDVKNSLPSRLVIFELKNFVEAELNKIEKDVK